MTGKRRMIGAALGCALFLAGCAQPGRALVKYDRGGIVRVTETPVMGMYVLYAGGGPNPEITYMLKKGDALGFSEEDGKSYAVAGAKKTEIDPKQSYIWKLQED